MNTIKLAKLAVKLASVKLVKKNMQGEALRLRCEQDIILDDIIELLHKHKDRIIAVTARQILRELSDVVCLKWLKIELNTRTI